MKNPPYILVLLLFVLGGCVNDYNKPWVEKADSLVGKTLTTAREMVVVAQGDRRMLVPLGSGTRRFTETTEHQKVVANVPVGSEIRVRKRTFRVSKPGRYDVLVVDVDAGSEVHRELWLIVDSSFLAEENFQEMKKEPTTSESATQRR